MAKGSPENKHYLIEAYRRFLQRVHDKIESIDERDLQEAFEHAKETAIELGELTREEAQVILTYVKRDIETAAEFLNETGESLSNWMKLDVTLLELRLWQHFSKVADQSQIEMLKLNYRLKRGPLYRSGELVGLGTLQCDHCGELLTFKKVSEIPTCPQCHQAVFSRLRG